MLKSVTIFYRIVAIFCFATIWLEPSPFWLKPSLNIVVAKLVDDTFIIWPNRPSFSFY